MTNFKSRPVRARGLKQIIVVQSSEIDGVAPRAGAWIETLTIRFLLPLMKSRPVRARGLKPAVNAAIAPTTGRAPCGRVD